MADGAYEGVTLGRLQTPLEIRKQAYWSYLAGGHHSYGHDESNSAPSEWRSWIDSRGVRHLGVCRTVLTGLHEWWHAAPDQSLFAAGEGSGIALNVAARSADGDWAVFYLASKASVTVKMADVCGGKATQAVWIDPTTGARRPVEKSPPLGTRDFTPPHGWADAVLLFERRALPPSDWQ